jgi:hypothetical protein
VLFGLLCNGTAGGETRLINRQINLAIVLEGEIDQIDIRLLRGDVCFKSLAIDLLREFLKRLLTES